MKKKIFILVELINSMYLIFIPFFVMKVCGISETHVGVCNYSAKAEIAVGIAMLFSTLILIKKEIVYSALIQIVNNLIALTIPTLIIGSCKIATMRCNMITFPTMYVVCSIMIVIYIAMIVNRRYNSESK